MRDRAGERRKVVTFLNRIGLGAREGDFDHRSFLDNVSIKGGTITFKPGASASNILHEAGHLAILPGEFRHLVETDTDRDLREHYKRWFDEHPNALGCFDGTAEHPTARAILQSSECEANAWAYAAAIAIGIDSMIPFEEGFDGGGDTVHHAISIGGYFGINGLFHAGMCRGRDDHGHSINTFPVMTRWMQV